MQPRAAEQERRRAAPDVFCEARCAGLSPWFAPVCGGGGGVYCGLVRHALCIFEPRSTPNELGLIAVTLFSEGRVAVWPLAVAAEERQHAIHRCLGSRAATSIPRHLESPVASALSNCQRKSYRAGGLLAGGGKRNISKSDMLVTVAGSPLTRP
jgi:hypothetical protein